MEWANGDVRINVLREGPFSRIPERGDTASTGVAARRDNPSKTHISINEPPLPPRDKNPNYYQHTVVGVPYGIVHPKYKLSNKRYCETNLPQSYPLQREEQHGSQQVSEEYPSLPRGFPSSSSAFTAPLSDDSCSQVCSECPGKGAPCEYGGPPLESSYPMVELHPSCIQQGQQQQQQQQQQRPDSYYLEVIDSGGAVSGSGPGGSSGAVVGGPVTAPDTRSVQSHQSHNSHCDLRDFEEWRGLRGSRESLGSLPPDLQRHLQNCRCQCDHLGYGNYQVSFHWQDDLFV